MTDRIVAALEALEHARSPGSFACRLSLPVDALRLSVTGVGEVSLPVASARAKALAGTARPAPFGLGDRTLHDRSVRDVGEIAASRVRIDARRWRAALEPALERVREELGLPEGTLEARLHKLLVYGKGQFFLPHRDTERDDDMLATLVVVLPSRHRGGTLTVEHKGEKRRFTAPRANAAPALTLFAFYADCTHEVKPVTEGTRLTLSYQLHFTSAETNAPGDAAGDATKEAAFEALARTVGAFFETAERGSAAKGTHTLDRVDKLVCLLDHEYSSRSLVWPRLKGADAIRALGLRYAALALDLQPWLAHVDIEETWSAQPAWGEDDGYDLEELIDRGATLEGWRDAHGEPRDFPSLYARESELCRDGGLEDTEPEHEQYEGWMGNYGDTLERRYRSSAIVLWPTRHHHRVLLGMGADTLLRELVRETGNGDEAALDRARDGVRSILESWMPHTRSGNAETLLGALTLCERLDDPALALELLVGFRAVAFTPRATPSLIALGERFGEGFCRSFAARLGGAPSASASVEGASDEAAGQAPATRAPVAAGGRDARQPEPARRLLEWVGDFAKLSERVHRTGAAVWRAALPVLFERLHEALRETHREHHAAPSPSTRDRAVEDEIGNLVALLDAAAAMADDEANARVLDALIEDIAGYRPDVPVRVLEHATDTGGTRGRAVEALREATLARLRTALERSARDADDWRIAADLDCTCADCRRLGEFLDAHDERALDLPLAKARRAHLHGQIDGRELPLSHETRRRGSPYTLELRKLPALFERDRERHARANALLRRLEASTASG